MEGEECGEWGSGRRGGTGEIYVSRTCISDLNHAIPHFTNYSRGGDGASYQRQAPPPQLEHCVYSLVPSESTSRPMPSPVEEGKYTYAYTYTYIYAYALHTGIHMSNCR